MGKPYKKLKFIIFLLFLIGINANLSAQSTILDQTLLSQSSFDTFTTVNVTGTQSWHSSISYGAVCSGYSAGQNFENEDWLVSSEMNLEQAEDVYLTFQHTRGSAQVMNVGVAEGWYKVYATANYTGDPSSTEWIELDGLNLTIPSAWQYVDSGELTIPDVAKSANSRIAFRYQSNATVSATWEIKNVKVMGDAPNAPSTFKVTNWNIEWFGCTTFGPEDEILQTNNVVSALLSMDSDVYCLQEISNTETQPSIETLVNLMGSNDWGGYIVPDDTGDCNQHQAIIYKKSRVQFVSATELSSGSSSQGNSYYYNWASGRYPAMYNVNFISGNTSVPVSLVNIHAKAEDGNAASYTRRKGGSIGLKTILDGANYNSKNVILTGDFNDYLNGTTSTACACTDSPFKNFMDDTVNYTGITQDLINVYSGWQQRPVIEHTIVSNELSDKFVAGSAIQEEGIADGISNFLNTTSNHLPVSMRFEFATLDTLDFAVDNWTIYPTIATDKVIIATANSLIDTTIAIYDLTGRTVIREKLKESTINVSALPSGIYILKLGSKSVKFVKK